MSDMGDMIGLGLKIAGAFALAAAAVVGVGIYAGVEHHNETKTTTSLKLRAEDTLRDKSLKVITLEKFKKDASCGNERPYGADFVAQGTDGKVVRGHICSSPDRESIVNINP